MVRLLYVHSSIAIILMGKRELIALLNLSSWCLVMVERLFIAMLRGCLHFVIVVFPDHTHLLFLVRIRAKIEKNTLCGRALVRVIAKIERHILFGKASVRIRAKKGRKKTIFFVCKNIENTLFGSKLVSIRAKIEKTPFW